ncbi:MAG: hypothetical protein JNM19_16795 [Chitinophagaceae bacterium]|nr:hypothetical protein [Chitinophagaceae bacterium]
MRMIYSMTAFLILSVTVLSGCGQAGKTEKKPGPAAPVAAKDTPGNDLQCKLTIDGKEFLVAPEDIDATFTFSDSSVNITFKKIGSGFITLHIPGMYKCPCSIPAGYSSVNTKVAGTENEYAIQPTVTLNSYPVEGISFHNLSDGYHEGNAGGSAATIQTLRATGEGTSGSGYEYLIKGRIHTTVLKNVYESAAGDKNKDYRIEGSFVIRPRLYL